MWSDSFKALKALLALVLLIAVCARYVQDTKPAGEAWPRAVAAGKLADGRHLRFSLWQVSSIQGPDLYTLSKVVKDVRVTGDTSMLHVGDTVSVVGRYRAADQVVVAEITEVHRLRKWKERLGYLGIAASILAAPFGFRLRRWGLAERG